MRQLQSIPVAPLQKNRMPSVSPLKFFQPYCSLMAGERSQEREVDFRLGKGIKHKHIKRNFGLLMQKKLKAYVPDTGMRAMNVTNLLRILFLKKLKHRSLSATVEGVIFFTYLHIYNGLVVSSHPFSLLTHCFVFLAFPSLPHSQLNFSPNLGKLDTFLSYT